MASRVTVRISPDRLSAVVLAAVPVAEEPPVSESEIRQALHEAGVVYGVDSNLIGQAILVAGNELDVAHGARPTEGTDGSIRWTAEMTTPTARPQIGNDGRADFHQLNLVGKVAKGQVLAVRIPAVPGVAGTGVDGQPIPPGQVKEAVLPKGKNIIPSEDGSQAIAGIDGHLTLLGNGYAVLPILEVSGDVDFSTGDIDFPGLVRITGNIGNGFLVRATGDILVGGTVSGGKVEAGGKVNVCRGIVGHSYVQAAGDIEVKFIENGEVSSLRNVTVSDAILYSRVSAGGRVIVTGIPGSIVGGVIRARLEVSCNSLGGNLGAVTEVEVGASPQDRQRLKEVIPRLAKTVKEEEKALAAVRMITDLKARGQMPAGINTEMIERLASSLDSLHRERQELENEQQELTLRLEAIKVGRVIVRSGVRAGVKVTVGPAMLSVDEDMGPAGFVLSPSGDVTVGPV